MKLFRPPDTASPSESKARINERPGFMTRLFGAYLCYGGIIGLDAVSKAGLMVIRASPGGADLAGLVILTMITILYALLLLAGLGLILGWRGAWATAIGTQILQSVMFAVPFGKYMFLAGFYAGFFLEQGIWRVNSGWTVFVTLGTESDRTYLGVNFVPPIILTVFYLLRRKGLKANSD